MTMTASGRMTAKRPAETVGAPGAGDAATQE